MSNINGQLSIIKRARSGKASNTKISEVDRAVGSLADGIQKAMSSLYSLQTALINALARRRGSSFSTLLQDFKKNRQIFRADWEKVILFLQQCYAYADDYVSLCEFAIAEPTAPQNWAFLRDVLTIAKKVLVEARAVKSRHEKVFKELRKHRSKLSSALQNTEPPQDEPQAANRKPHIDPSQDALLRAAHESLHPNGPNALVDSFAALEQTSTALADLLVFWRNHVDQLVTLSSNRTAKFPVTSEDLRSSADDWKRHQVALLAATSSISASSDAVTVNATGALSQTERSRSDDAKTGRSGFWTKCRHYFGGKGPP